MTVDTLIPVTVTEPSAHVTHELTRHASTSTDFSSHARVKDGNPLPLTDTEGVDVDAVRCPYCNLPMFVERSTRHCVHCDWRLCPACQRHYSLKKAPIHEIED